MDIRQLRYFVRIAETGGFGKAAAELRIAQSALSYQIRQLEQELHVTLFDRHRTGVSLTEAGRAVLERANAVFQELNALRADASAHARYPSGQVSFAAPPSVARVLAPQVVERFRTLYPDVRLAMREASREFLPGLILQLQVDLVLLYEMPNSPQLTATPLLYDRLCLVGSPALPQPPPEVTLAEIADLPYVMTSMTFGWRTRFEKALADRNLRLFVRAEVDSLSVMKELIGRGFGYSALPRSAVHAELRRGELWAMPLPVIVVPTTLTLVTGSHHAVSVAARELRRLIIEEAARLAAEGWGHPGGFAQDATIQELDRG